MRISAFHRPERGIYARRAMQIAFTALCAAPALPAAAQQSISMIVATTPGTGVDTTAREIGQQFLANRGTVVVVENRPGASGNIGAAHVARSKPDGNTLLVAATTFATNATLNTTTLPYDPIKDFAPVALLGTGALALVVPSSSPINTLKDLIAAAKAKPGILNYASPGNGTPQHLAFELFKQEAGIDLLHVPFKGTGGAINDVAGAHVSATIGTIPAMLPLITANKLRPLAVMSPARSPSLPDVPTFKELGLAKLQVDVWYAMFAPAGTPAATIAQLNQDVNAALKNKGVIQTLAQQGIDPAGGPPEVLAAKLREELDRWPPVIRAAGITAD